MELTMLKKFETKTNRVKGLAFHPYRSWILVSLHNGSIQLYDYRMEILLSTFDEHDGPVRGIDFHKSQPLFVSGGDDYKVKVWNYSLKRCLYTLHGHLDYIRTVFFHPKDQPWVLSASDDQTVRIWNWQSRTCLAVLTGHNHYVMCAQWHPSEDLILSASLDQTIRVWDISGLRKRNTSIINENQNTSGTGDVFGSVDAVVKFVLEGHSRGVNWASFHPTNNLVVSGADDREVKVWRMSGTRAWETTTYRGHLNNVSCVLFHPKENVIISNSEDKTLRIWDIARNYAPLCFRRESDRYWILAAHPRLNLLAAGHDNGMLIFKLSRERPPFWCDTNNDTILYWSDSYIRSYNLNNSRHEPLLQTRANTGSGFGTRRQRRPRRLLYNPYCGNKEHNMLLFYSGDESEYELYTMDRKGNSQAKSKSSATACAFVTRNRFAVLDSLGEIQLKNMENESKRKIKIPERTINYLFYGGAGRLILRSPEWITLFDVASRKIIREIQIPSRFPIKFVSWSHDFSKVALLARFSVMICDEDLNDICTIYENAKVKSGVWDKNGVFVYTTVTHMKYALPTGDHGIIKTLDGVLYVASVRDDEVHCMTRENQVTVTKIDNTEYVFKKALTERRYGDVQRLIEEGKLRGESIISYLQSKGFPEVALRFVEEVQTRFELALECGNIDDAFECATKISTEKCWNRFGEAALMQGNYRYVTEAYKQTLNFEKLMYLFVLTGNYPMLEKLFLISKNRDDRMMCFNISMLTGNVENRLNILEESNQNGLAYLTALSHGMDEDASRLLEKLGDKNIKLPRIPSDNDKIFSAPKPIWGPWTDDSKYDWPHIEIKKGFFDQEDVDIKTKEDYLAELEIKKKKAQAALDSGSDRDSGNDFGDGDDGNDAEFGFDDWADNTTTTKNKNQSGKIKGDGKKSKSSSGAPSEAAAWGGDDDLGELELSEDEDDGNEEKDGGSGVGGIGIGSGLAGIGGSDYFVMPKHGSNFCDKWGERSTTISDMIASGKFDIAQEALHRQFGIINFEPLKKYFLQIYTSSHGELPIIPNASDISVGLRRNVKSNSILPAIGVSLSHCHGIRKQAYELVSRGEFNDAILLFQSILHIIPLIIISTSDELKDARQCIKTCREYINALRVGIAAKENKNDANRRFELYCYFTHFDLQDGHIFSGLYLAMKSGYTSKNFHTTAVICRRLLELSVSVKSDGSVKIVSQAKKVLTKCQKKINESDTTEDNIEYKPHDFNQLCCMSLTPIGRGDKSVKSPYCGSVFKQEYDGQVSPVCNLVRIGANAPGVTITK